MKYATFRIHNEKGGRVMEKIMKCEMCGKQHSVDIIKEKALTYIKDEPVEYEETVYYCCNCDEDEAYYVPSEVMNQNLMKARNAYRKMKGLMTSDEIVTLRKKYNLSQVELSKILDFGEATISRYESKSIQDETHDNILRIVSENPIELLKLLDKNKNQFEEYNYNLIRNHIVDVIEEHDNALIKRRNLENYYAKYSEPTIENGYTLLNIDKLEQVVNFVAFNFSVLNKVLLMKLLWYSDVMSYKEKNVSITGLVYEHKDMGALPLGHSALMELSGIDVRENYSNDFDYPTYTVYPKECDFSLLSEKEKNIILKVCKKFRNYSGKQIAKYMHEETAYIKTEDREIIPFSYANDVRDF